MNRTISAAGAISRIARRAFTWRKGKGLSFPN